MVLRRLLILIALLSLTFPLAAQRGRPGTGNPEVQFVPWRVLPKGSDLVKGPMVVYWLPASLKELENSPLQKSSVLLESATLCVGFEVVAPEDAATIAKLGVTGRAPMALITGEDGRVVRQVDNDRPKSIEAMVTAELDARGEQVLHDLQKAKAEKSVELYKRIWDDRCLYPLIGLEAQRGLKELGVIVQEPPSTLAPDPNLKVETPKKKPRG